VENAETGERCGPNETGEICIKSAHSGMLGYLNKPKSAYYDFEGFGRTGDLGYYDEEGKLYYVDRMKELIKYCWPILDHVILTFHLSSFRVRNQYVSPTELEDIMQRHPAVRQSLAFGIPHRVDQERIAMVVALNDGQKPTAEELMAHVNAEVTSYKRVQEIIFRDVIPTNSVGKMTRYRMREWAKTQQKESQKEQSSTNNNRRTAVKAN